MQSAYGADDRFERGGREPPRERPEEGYLPPSLFARALLSCAYSVTCVHALAECCIQLGHASNSQARASSCTNSFIHLAHWSRAALIVICVLQRVAG